MPIEYNDLGTDLKNRVRTALVNKGKTLYVHATNGNNASSGRSWNTAYLTMAKAFENLSSGDTIVFAGKIKEQLTTPVRVFDVTIIGAGTRTRHADNEPTPIGGKSSNTWTTPDSATAATPLVKVLQQGWRFENILFASLGDSNTLNAAVQLYRDSGSGDAERDASHASFVNCRFASGHGGINDTGGCTNVLVQNCRFEALTGYCIQGVGNIGVGQSNWKITDNDFDNFTNGVKIAGFGCRIQNNTFTDGGTPNTTYVLVTDVSGGDDNFVVDNYFQTLTANFNTPDVVGTATDVWARNVSFDSTSPGVGTNTEWGRPA